MRQMFEFVSSVGQQVAKTLTVQIKNGGENSFEFKDLARKFTVDTIATCAFGIEVNSFENPKNDFHRIAGKVANFSSFITTLKFAGYFAVPKLMRALKIKFFDEETTDFFQKAINETMRYRESEGVVRHDMINLLIQAKLGKLTHEKEPETKKSVEGFATVEESQVGRNAVTRKWDDDDLYAQCFIFFFAGEISKIMNHRNLSKCYNLSSVQTHLAETTVSLDLDEFASIFFISNLRDHATDNFLFNFILKCIKDLTRCQL